MIAVIIYKDSWLEEHPEEREWATNAILSDLQDEYSGVYKSNSGENYDAFLLGDVEEEDVSSYLYSSGDDNHYSHILEDIEFDEEEYMDIEIVFHEGVDEERKFTLLSYMNEVMRHLHIEIRVRFSDEDKPEEVGNTFLCTLIAIEPDWFTQWFDQKLEELSMTECVKSVTFYMNDEEEDDEDVEQED